MDAAHALRDLRQPWLMIDIPRMDYEKALDLQHALVDAKYRGGAKHNLVLMLEHPPVFTFGRRGGREFLLKDDAFLRAHGITSFQVERGGLVTYHGPGQLVIYPIINLRETGWGVMDLVQALEDMVIRLTADWGIYCERNPLNRGVWVGNRKLASIGLAIRHWITFHGMSININPSLEPFTWMHPCGLAGIQATSMARELGYDVSMVKVREAVKAHLKTAWALELMEGSLEGVMEMIRDPSP